MDPKNKIASDKQESELDQYDLLAGDESVDTPTSSVLGDALSITTQAFNTKIQRKKREQEKSISEAEQATKKRHLLVLQSLMTIRKSLREVTRIDLGERFKFALLADDWQGWPRLSIQLKDSLQPQADYPCFRVQAHDRHSRGSIEIDYDPSQAAESISVLLENDLKRLPATLKRCVRSFLDLTGDIVLAAERQSSELEEEKVLEKRQIEGLIEAAEKQARTIDANLFEDVVEDNILETLPSLDEVESLNLSFSKK